jgi:hypothetical protein
MLEIRPVQMEALAEAHRELLPIKIARFLCAECPAQARLLTDRQLLEGINESLERATRYDLRVEWDLCRFCWLAMLYGAHFDEDAQWAADILESAAWQPSEKIDRLEHYHANYLCRQVAAVAVA